MKQDGIVGRPIRLNKQRLTPKGDYAEVMFVGDCHVGSPQFDEERLLANLNYCFKNSIYIFLTGDLVECSTRHSVGCGVYEQKFPVEIQHEKVVERLRPLANKGLIIGSLSGNHSERVFKEVGFNISKALCRELDIPYLGDACWNKFIVGSESYDIYALHGRSNARFDGTALLAVERISSSFFCDMLIHAHMHKCCNSIVLQQKIVHGQVVEHKKHLLITGSYLKFDGGYAQTAGLPPSKLGSPKVRFYSNRHDILVSW
jgi:hypothetical protein